MLWPRPLSLANWIVTFPAFAVKPAGVEVRLAGRGCAFDLQQGPLLLRLLGEQPCAPNSSAQLGECGDRREHKRGEDERRVGPVHVSPPPQGQLTGSCYAGPAVA